MPFFLSSSSMSSELSRNSQFRLSYSSWGVAFTKGVPWMTGFGGFVDACFFFFRCFCVSSPKGLLKVYFSIYPPTGEQNTISTSIRSRGCKNTKKDGGRYPCFFRRQKLLKEERLPSLRSTLASKFGLLLCRVHRRVADVDTRRG